MKEGERVLRGEKERVRGEGESKRSKRADSLWVGCGGRGVIREDVE